MKLSRISILALAIIAPTLSIPAHAYVGPGAGVSLIGAAVGLILAILFALGVVVLWPLRRLMKQRKGARQELDANDVAQAGAESD